MTPHRRDGGDGPTARARPQSKPTATTRTSPFDQVHLELHEVVCRKTTKEVDRDEIVLTALSVVGEVREQRGRKELAARARKGEWLDAGKFGKGDSRSFPKGRRVASFPYGGAKVPFPRHYFATLLLVEKDEGHLGEVLNAAAGALEERAVAATQQLAGNVAAALLASA
ncbi:MAG TPA: hypothetical protein VJP77_08265, partial [Planctomycetota bacterium]|nr:hypothetical protein [Planctomycetota bacterium]